MTTIEKILEVDSILAGYEDWMHGEDGDNCTRARYILDQVKEELHNIEKGETNVSDKT